MLAEEEPSWGQEDDNDLEALLQDYIPEQFGNEPCSERPLRSPNNKSTPLRSREKGAVTSLQTAPKRARKAESKTLLRFYPRSKSTRAAMEKVGYKPKYEILVPDRWKMSRVLSKLKLKWPKGSVGQVFSRGTRAASSLCLSADTQVQVCELVYQLGLDQGCVVPLSYSWTETPATSAAAESNSLTESNALHGQACADLLAAVDSCSSSPVSSACSDSSDQHSPAAALPMKSKLVLPFDGALPGSGGQQSEQQPTKRRKRIEPTFLRPVDAKK